MVKVFIDPGHGGTDPGAVGNGLQEKNLTLTIARLIREMLLNEFVNVEVRMSRNSDITVSLAERSTLANNWNANYFLSIHINAGGGTGFESYIHSSVPSRTRQLQQVVHPAIISEIQVTNRGQKNANFAVLRNTSMPAILTENLFIDRTSDANLLKDPSFLNRVARGHVNGIAQAFNLQRKPTPPPAGTLYKIQAGAFSDKANADRMVSRLRADGYNPYLYQEGGLWKVQVGAFSNRTNAEDLISELARKGYQAAIVL
ncbi:N-acetylmuramoyl-L-alanine amidase [Alkalihalophilus marmarensis]|jgi:N-acetylmuramoyl-L-alanine amidase|uniref:N-acetylmuramoyl-L-alanine amidase n=1 Tax=Alkalihalophilus marmarensis DSM 21297 TaxID=1188261 RepID=U6SQA8_9BACI|nr:N-acetylmuramoyl-L-alanine amidase [Alkalihalophilus marmarensis]ERN53567.1 N-acetylmuramoyl-L-alanine amidase [Alkalihalophilus marmarensis DSM 21297]MCM3490046.1 N-acetylmuramoyl-L-alanine amidase [Alkalihalophilus marmarensis]